jgi:hypothetical protein
MRYSVQFLSLCSIVLVLIAGCSQSGGQQSSSHGNTTAELW